MPYAKAVSRTILIPLWALALMVAVLAIHRGASRLVHDELAAQSRATLDLYVANLRGRLDKFRSQPILIAEHPVTRALFDTPVPEPAAIAAATARSVVKSSIGINRGTA